MTVSEEREESKKFDIGHGKASDLFCWKEISNLNYLRFKFWWKTEKDFFHSDDFVSQTLENLIG